MRSPLTRAVLVAALAGAAALTGTTLTPPVARADIAVDQQVAPSILGTPPDAQAGSTYSFRFDTGATNPPPVFTLLSGALPEGIALYSDGQLAGFTTTVGTAGPVTIQADNGVGSPATLTFSMTVDPGPPSFTNVPDATTTIPVAVPYYRRYYARGVPVTPTISAPAEDLPPGLTMDEYGELQGTPTTVGTYTFVVTATNGTSPDATLTRTVVVTGTGPSISGDAPDTTAFASYDYRYALGGSPGATATVIAGQLPPGLALSADGHLSGLPVQAGTYGFTVAADNVVGPRATLDDSITVAASVATLGGTPPKAAVGEPYDFSFDTGATLLPDVTVRSGRLPAGLQLSPWGELHGTPSRAGTYRFTVGVSDLAGGTASEPVTLRVLPVPAVSIGDASVREGDAGTTPELFRVTLSRPSTVPVTVRWATANGTARAGSDYRAAAGTLVFAPGQTTRSIVVQVTGDRTREPDEVFSVRLTGPAHATIGHGTATGRIRNDD